MKRDKRPHTRLAQTALTRHHISTHTTRNLKTLLPGKYHLALLRDMLTQATKLGIVMFQELEKALSTNLVGGL